MIWRPENSHPTDALTSWRVGLASMTTRLPASWGLTSSAALRTSGRICSYFQSVGVEVEDGSQGSMSLATVHRAPAETCSSSA